MFCDHCHQREANVFLTQIIAEHTSKISLCGVCGADIRKQAETASGFSSDFAGYKDRVLAALASTDPQYTLQAYSVVVRAVEHASRSTPQEHHVYAAAVAEAFREIAIAEFATQALPTLAGWGIHSCDDIGAIVFQLVAARLFGSRPEERAQDFSGLYNFAEAFPTSASSETGIADR